MKRIFTFLFGAIIVLLLLFILFLLVKYGIIASKYIIAGFLKLKPEIYVPLVFTIMTAVIGLAAALITQARIRKRAIEEAHRDKKVALYLGILKYIQTLMLSQKEGFEHLITEENDQVEKMAQFKTELNLWASPQALQAFHAFTHPDSSKNGPMAILKLIDPFYKEMRKDIGLSNRGLDDLFFARSMLSDPSEIEQLKE
ncbi:MAG: hypothetical protein JKX71_06570 [Amylibacter sp.]|nr:hypothetical protein [Amylibacter sp.]